MAQHSLPQAYPWSELWEAWERGAKAGSFAINIQNSPVACTVNHSSHRVATTIGYRYIIEKQDLSETGSVSFSAIGKPYCSLTATKVKAKVSHTVIHSLAHHIAIVSYILAYSSEYRQVSH